MVTTYRKSVAGLEPGDVYLWGEVGELGRTTREVLAVVTLGPFGSVLLEVRKADGNVTRSHLSGLVDVLAPGELKRCMHITPRWIGARFTDGAEIRCGYCLPRDAGGHVLGTWDRAAVEEVR